MINILLSGDSVWLSEVCYDDVLLQKYVIWMNDKKVRKTLPNPSRFTTEAMAKDYLSHSTDNKFAIVDQKTADVIGFCELKEIDSNVPGFTIQVVIGERAFMKEGVYTDVVNTLCRHLFKVCNTGHIQMKVNGCDSIANEACERLGFIHIGTVQRAVYWGGRYYSVDFYDLMHYCYSFANSKGV